MVPSSVPSKYKGLELIQAPSLSVFDETATVLEVFVFFKRFLLLEWTWLHMPLIINSGWVPFFTISKHANDCYELLSLLFARTVLGTPGTSCSSNPVKKYYCCISDNLQGFVCFFFFLCSANGQIQGSHAFQACVLPLRYILSLLQIKIL